MVLAAPGDVSAQGRGVLDVQGTRETQVGQQVDAVLVDDTIAQGKGAGSAVAGTRGREQQLKV